MIVSKMTTMSVQALTTLSCVAYDALKLEEHDPEQSFISKATQETT